MRFLYKRPKMDHVSEELETLMDVMSSDIFIVVDLLLLSLIFSLLLSPALHSLSSTVLIFCGSNVLFNSMYFFIFKKLFRNR